MCVCVCVCSNLDVDCFLKLNAHSTANGCNGVEHESQNQDKLVHIYGHNTVNIQHNSDTTQSMFSITQGKLVSNAQASFVCRSDTQIWETKGLPKVCFFAFVFFQGPNGPHALEGEIRNQTV